MSSNNESQEDVEERRQLIQWIADKLNGGSDESKIVEEMVAAGFKREAAEKAVNAVSKEWRSATRKNRFVSTVGGWAVLLVAFGLLNGALWGGQELYHRGHVADAKALYAQLDSAEAEITTLKQAWAAMEARSAAIDALEATNPAAYKDSVAVWNDEVPRIEALALYHDSAISRFNTKLEEYNKLAKRAYSRWYLIPIPGGSRSHARSSTH